MKPGALRHHVTIEGPAGTMRAVGRAAPTYPAGSYPAAVVADGATAYWRLNDSSGTTAVDVIGGNNGTISGGVTLGQAGALADGDKAMSFDGTTSFIAVPDTAILNFAGSFTLEAWIKTVSTGRVPIVGKESSVTGFGYQLEFGTSPGLLAMHTGVAWVYTPPVNLNDGLWHHVVGLWNGTVVKIYVDGIEKASSAPAGGVNLSNTVALEIGRFYGSIYAAGSLDDVAIYPTALTPTQIAAHYAARTWVPPVAPLITSATADTFTIGTAETFTVTTSGTLPISLTLDGPLPAGITFVDTGNGTATVSGTATVAATVSLALLATNSAGHDLQAFTLTTAYPIASDWWCAIQESTGQTTMTGRFHPGITTATRIHHKGRIYHVDTIANRDDRDVELTLTCREVFD